MVRWEYIVIHHSLTKDAQTVSWSAIRKYHRSKHWADIGYHWGIELIGDYYEILMGRSMLEEGAHCKEAEMNKKGLGICLVGDFDSNDPPFQQLIVAVKLVRSLMETYRIPRQNVIGHREAGAMVGLDWAKGEYKSCPGKLFSMDNFRRAL